MALNSENPETFAHLVKQKQPEIAVSAEEKNMLFGHLSMGNPAWLESVSAEASVGAADSAMNRVN